ncbi:hypothetical protein HHI36_010560 [Cryptolaemus montrouzieri]|uniref:Uncharacterized protein n=1 Tax=Cryptolaemus montrouzieri TaxID=559131 RepID=A0ABD2MJ60_9CUCU
MNTKAESVFNVRLPKIDLPTFNGDYDSWLPFRDSFKTMIHENKTLLDVQKFHYIRSSLKGQASSIINALEISEDNYKIALDLLNERYDNRRVIIQTHVKSLMELPNLLKEHASKLRKMLDNINMHIRALKSLGEPVETWDTLLIIRSHKSWIVTLIKSSKDQ